MQKRCDSEQFVTAAEKCLGTFVDVVDHNRLLHTEASHSRLLRTKCVAAFSCARSWSRSSRKDEVCRSLVLLCTKLVTVFSRGQQRS